jgi:trans-2,3-dihydro-3-hydroxyanthranilate isomerase
VTDALAVLAGHRPLPASGAARRYAVMDVFADRATAGNALAVFFDGRGLETSAMQRLAREFNLSETVFLLPAEHGGDVRARIFTPGSELPFAGHPVLGSALLVGTALGRGRLTLETAAGPVEVELSRERLPVMFGRMAQPLPTWSAFARAPELLQALGLARAHLPVEAYVNGPTMVLVRAGTPEEIASLRPDLRALEELGEIGVSCFAGSGRTWRTRMFAPALGVPEDPATGSAAGPIALHLARHGEIAFGEEIELHQGEEIGRPSRLLARALGTRARAERVEVAGDAVVVAEGAFAT